MMRDGLATTVLRLKLKLLSKMLRVLRKIVRPVFYEFFLSLLSQNINCKSKQNKEYMQNRLAENEFKVKLP